MLFGESLRMENVSEVTPSKVSQAIRLERIAVGRVAFRPVQRMLGQPRSILRYTKDDFACHDRFSDNHLKKPPPNRSKIAQYWAHAIVEM